jgi:hypothetical protein
VELLERINCKLKKQSISSAIILSKFRMISESSRKSSAYTDPRYVPFYYYLSQEIKPKKMVEIGFRLGLLSGVFLMGSKSVERFLAFQKASDDKFYSPRLGKHNIQDHYKGLFDVYVGDISDEKFEQLFENDTWDLLIINEETTYDQHMQYLEFAWPRMSSGGFIIMDYINYHKPSGDAYKNFCKVQSRDPVVFDTKYGVGLMEK